jgi:hypothetical protein
MAFLENKSDDENTLTIEELKYLRGGKPAESAALDLDASNQHFLDWHSIRHRLITRTENPMRSATAINRKMAQSGPSFFPSDAFEFFR